MRKRIGTKTYDTKTARAVCRRASGKPGSGAYLRETLMRNPRGLYFVHLEGGKDSRVAGYEGAQSKPGERIVPMSREEAIAFATPLLDGDALYWEFKTKGADEPCQLTALVPRETRERLKERAKKEGKPVGQVVRELVEGYLES